MGMKLHWTSVRDDERYQAFRRDSASKPYEDWSRDELYDKAKKVGVDGRSNMSKMQLISALRNH